MKPLDGVRVLDFSTLVPGPLATLFLATAGAEVIKVERPGRGDEMRSYAPKIAGESVNFALLNRGKKSIAVDLKREDARDVLNPLIGSADVLVEQFRPGVMERLGLGYDAIKAINPRIVYCSITGYGQTGPLAAEAGHDLNYIATSGMLALSMGSLEQPVIPPALIADIAGGAYPAVMNILLGLRLADRSGKGSHLDISMTENLFPFLYWALGTGSATGEWPGNGTDLVTGGTPRYRLYAAADGGMIAAAPIEQKFWETFCNMIALPTALRDDTRDPAATTAEVARLIATKPAADWQALFETRDCCCCMVRSLEEALQLDHFGARNVFGKNVRFGDGQTMPALPLPLSTAFRATNADLDAGENVPSLDADGASYLETDR